MDIAIVSCRELPEPDPDAAPLAAAFAEAGIESRVLAWDDESVDWSSARLALLRSCWNYPRHHRAFLEWAATTAERTRLWNPLSVLRWNLHKGYLLELERAGVPVTPTVLVPRSSETTLDAILRDRGWSRAVVKPAVSAASYRTMRVDATNPSAGEAHLTSLCRDGDVLVQEYLPSVEDYGERALVWIDGRLTHAVRKSPRFDGEDESVSGAMEIRREEAELADRALSIVDGDLLYARIDVAPGPNGDPVVMELELLEPSLFFVQEPRALRRFVRAAIDRL